MFEKQCMREQKSKLSNRRMLGNYSTNVISVTSVSLFTTVKSTYLILSAGKCNRMKATLLEGEVLTFVILAE